MGNVISALAKQSEGQKVIVIKTDLMNYDWKSVASSLRSSCCLITFIMIDDEPKGADPLQRLCSDHAASKRSWRQQQDHHGIVIIIIIICHYYQQQDHHCILFSHGILSELSQ